MKQVISNKRISNIYVYNIELINSKPIYNKQNTVNNIINIKINKAIINQNIENNTSSFKTIYSTTNYNNSKSINS